MAVLALGLLAFALGFLDMLHPVFLSAQIVGLSYALSGVVSVGGSVWLLAAQCRHPRRSAALVTGIAGGYVAGSFALYARTYRTWWFVVSLLIFAASCALILLALHSNDLKNIGKAAGAAGISVAVVFTGAQLWYASIYSPRNTDIAVSSSAAVGTPYRISRKTVLVPVTLELQNHSSMTAVALNSQFVVTATRYHSHLLSPSAKTQAEIGVGLSNNSNPQSLSVAYADGTKDVTRSLIAIGRIVGDGSYILPDATVVRPVDIEIPPGNFQEIDVETAIDYARSSRVSLGDVIDKFHPLKSHPSCIQARWNVRESNVFEFLRGAETLISDWCAGSEPYITTRFGGSGTETFSRAAVTRNDAAAAFIHSFRVSMFPLLLPAVPHTSTRVRSCIRRPRPAHETRRMRHSCRAQLGHRHIS